MKLKGIQKERELWVKILIVIAAIVLLIREVMMKQYIYIPLAILVIVACFFKKEHVFCDEGVDIEYNVCGLIMHNYWKWNEITTIHADYKKAAPNVMVHIGKDIVTRSFTMTPEVCNKACAFAAQMNPNIFIDNPNYEERLQRDQAILARQETERARKAAAKRKKQKK